MTFKVTHGMTGSSEYRAYNAAKNRCYNPNCPCYSKYGGRGITMCDLWKHSFDTFLQDMGLKPSPAHSLDRIDNNKGYYKDNCRWATIFEQNINRRNVKLISYKGLTLSAKEWSRRTGIGVCTIRKRIKEGYPPAFALTHPVSVNNFK